MEIDFRMFDRPLDVKYPSLIDGACRIRMTENLFNGCYQPPDARLISYEAHCLTHGHRTTVAIDKLCEGSVEKAETKAIEYCERCEKHIGLTPENRRQWLEFTKTTGTYSQEQLAHHQKLVDEGK